MSEPGPGAGRVEALPWEGVVDVLLQEAPIGVLLVGPGLVVERANAQACQILEMPAAELSGSPLQELMLDPSGRLESLLAESMEAGLPLLDLEVEVDLVQAGVTRPVAISSHPAPGRRTWLFVDQITEKVRVERQLALNDAMLNAASTGIVVSDARQDDMPLVYVNAAFESITGYTPAESIGRNCRFLQGADTDATAVQDLRTALAEGKPCEVVLLNYRRDGSPFWNELRTAPVRDATGKVTHFVGVQSDVSERVRAERERSELSRYNRLLLESTGEGMYGVDLYGHFTFVNAAAARMLGTEPDQLLGRASHATIHHSHVDGSPYPHTDCPVYQAMETNRGCRVTDEVFWRRDGTSFAVEYSSFPIVESGVVLGAVITFADITARKAVEAALQEAKDSADAANLAKSRFLASMSHELRTPLNAVIGYSEMLREEAEDLGAPGFAPDLARIEAAGRHLLSLIDSVLDLSKVEAGRMDVFVEEVDLAPLLDQVVATIQPLVERNGNRLQTEVDPGLGTMTTDSTKVRQVLFNLLSNAAKFSEKNQIDLRAWRNEDQICFAVRDRGIGIDSEEQERLFQPFSQAHPTISQKYGGTGLGLSLSRHFCRLLGGDITMESAKGAGSTFTVRLPVAGPGPDLVDEDAPGDEAASGASVLVVDDDPQARDLLAKLLARQGFRVIQAGNGVQALELAARWRPDAITLDVLMPRMDGWAVLARLKADPVLAGIPVVMVSVEGNRNLGIALGAVDVLPKPVDRERLRALLEPYSRPGLAVLVVEPDADARTALADSLRREGCEASTAKNLDEARALLSERNFAVVVIDLLMEDGAGVEFAAELQAHPGDEATVVVAISTLDANASDKVARMLPAGDLDQVIEQVLAMSPPRTGKPS